MEKQVRQAGYRIAGWCRAVGIGRSTFYTLPLELRPPSVKIGKSHIVTEAPEDYMKRIAGAQQHAEAA